MKQTYIGKTLYGFCDGFFGRDSTGNKVVEAIGEDWIVAREENGEPAFAYFEKCWRKDMTAYLEQWTNEEAKTG